jgi:BlaI family transcriptional regulator, penicillinase repressor
LHACSKIFFEVVLLKNVYNYFYSFKTNFIVLFYQIIKMIKQLTKAEEQIMQELWKLDKAFLREIIEALPEPKPHNNTVATVIKILVEKEFIGVNVFGRMHQYHALVSKEAYSKATMKTFVKGYFEGSFTEAVSFMVKENNLSIGDLELLLKELKKK